MHILIIFSISLAVFRNTLPVRSILFSWHILIISSISLADFRNVLPASFILFSLHTCIISLISLAVLKNTLPVRSILFSLHTLIISLISSIVLLEIEADKITLLSQSLNKFSICIILPTETLNIDVILFKYFSP